MYGHQNEDHGLESAVNNIGKSNEISNEVTAENAKDLSKLLGYIYIQLNIIMNDVYVHVTGCFKSQIRLAGGKTNHEGRLEIFYGGQWGTVCQNNFDIKDARVACRQLGFTEAMVVRKNAHKYYGRGRGRILLDRLECKGSELSLLHCGHRGIGVTGGCSHNNDVGVVCYKNGPHTICQKTANRNGKGKLNVHFEIFIILLFCKTVCLVQAHYNRNGKRICGGAQVYYNNKFGTICGDDGDRKEALVICRQLGYRGACKSYTCGTRCGGAKLPIWLNNLHCRGTESNLQSCPMSAWGRHNCNHDQDLGVCCKCKFNSKAKIMK